MSHQVVQWLLEDQPDALCPSCGNSLGWELLVLPSRQARMSVRWCPCGYRGTDFVILEAS